MSVYPRNLSNFLNRLSGYNKNNIKLNVLGGLTANDGDIIQVDLPSNSIVDLSSLAWSFSYANVALAADHSVSFPTNIEHVISRLAIEVNGQTLVNMNNYNALYHMLLYSTATEDYIRQRQVGQSNGVDNALSGVPHTVVDGAGVAAGGNTSNHVIDTWLGFLGSAKPNFIDTSLLGNVRISITLAPGNEVVGGAAAAATPDDAERKYALANMNFSIDVISISDGIYDSMVDQMLASGRPIEVPFKNYFSYVNNNTTGMSDMVLFNVASQSIDRLWCTGRDNQAGTTRTNAAAPLVAIADAAALFHREANTVPSFTFTNAGTTGLQFQINNTLYPNWQLSTAQEMFQHTKLAIGDQGNMLSGSAPPSATAYTTNYFVFAVSLEHHTDSDERFLSGIDTRGSSANCYLKGVGGANATQALVFAECTSSLKIMANKVLEIVQ